MQGQEETWQGSRDPLLPALRAEGALAVLIWRRRCFQKIALAVE